MLRVSDVWERALHAPGLAITEPDWDLPELGAEPDDSPIAGELHP
jgi:hypothetical protein